MSMSTFMKNTLHHDLQPNHMLAKQAPEISSHSIEQSMLAHACSNKKSHGNSAALHVVVCNGVAWTPSSQLSHFLVFSLTRTGMQQPRGCLLACVCCSRCNPRWCMAAMHHSASGVMPRWYSRPKQAMAATIRPAKAQRAPE